MRTWQVERDRLVGLAYRMLGSVSEAEEVVQEAFLRLHRTHGVENPGQWLTRVGSRLCLDQLGSARLDVADGRGVGVNLVANPDKLQHLRPPGAISGSSAKSTS